MGIDGIGSSVVIAFAAVLWFIYLVPTWLRRREYLSTERNAVRLQQTLRIMAETAQVPEAVRIETHAHAIAAQQRALRARRATLGETGPVPRADAAVELHHENVSSVSVAPRVSRSATRRLRRSRSVTTFVLLAAVVGSGFGVGELIASGAWVLLAASVTVAVGSIALLNQMSAVARARREGGVVHAAPSSVELYDDAEHESVVVDRGWVPQPVPKPLYLNEAEVRRSAPTSLPAAAHVNRVSAHEELLAAAAASEFALRAAHDSPEVTRVRAPEPEAAPSRFARMGVIDESDAAPADLDEILARRRAVG